MRGNGANAWRAQLLALLELLERRGQAQKAIALFIPEASAAARDAGALPASSLALKLLRAAVESRRPEWTQALAVERDPKRQRLSDGGQNDVVFAAKLAQSIVKTYAPTGAAAVKETELEDFVAALDLACVALYVVCALENAARLGDLVVDNLLYQVAKKLAEIPSMRVAASCVAACVHVRLWNVHAKVCKASDGDIAESSQLVMLLEQEDDCSSRVTQQLELAAEFPEPRSCHSEQFTRLLLGHVNTSVTLLLADKKSEAILQVADNTLSRWIDHLRRLPGQNPKLASSFSDRTFRILWKCAAAADGVKQKSAETASAALRFRSTALLFLLKCSNYTASYFIQQVHRVGVQHERATKRSQLGLQEVYAFYAREATALFQTVPDAPHMYTSESLQWEYVNWFEHFATVCDLSGMHLKSAMILKSVVHYVKQFGSKGASIQACLLYSVAGALFSAADSSKEGVCHSSESGRVSAAFDERLMSCTGKRFQDLFDNTKPSEWLDHCEKAARVYLKKLESLAPYSFVGLGSQDHGLFLARCIKRSSTKVFNYAISVQKTQLYRQDIMCFGNMCKALTGLRSSPTLTDIKTIETLILDESRLHRMAVMLSVRCCRTMSSDAAKPVLYTMSQHVKLVRELLDYTMMDGKPSESILQGILGDLNSIARECYACASSCYKAGMYQDTISALVGAFELAESYLEYVMCSKLSIEDIHKAHVHLKVDAIASVLAHCFREVGDVTKSREFNGFSLLYCGDISEKIPQASVDKYVSCILEEPTSSDVDMKSCMADVFKAFVDNATHVYKSRHIPEDQILRLWRSFQSAFERMSAKIVMNLRASTSDVPDLPSYDTVELCCTIESHLDGVLMGRAKNSNDCCDILLEIAHTLAKRKLLFCAYYTKHDFNSLIEGLLHTHRSLGAAAEKLEGFTSRADFDIGGVYGWRGVITLEMALIYSYAGTSHCCDAVGDIEISERSAIMDIEKCLHYWRVGENAFGCLFDEPHVITCLESVCNTLSLASCSATENAARNLLKTFEASEIKGTTLGCIPSPLLRVFGTVASKNALVEEPQVIGMQGTNNNEEVQGFEQVDLAISAARRSHCDENTVQACRQLRDAVAMLGALKATTKQRSTATVVKALGLREMLVHTILSDIHFREGRSTGAIIEAKSALRICWKMAKRFTAASSTVEAAYFDLPSELSAADWQHRKSAHLLYFMALESSSWDVLYAAKVSLCRIASLYCYSDQPHRAASYLTEAMRLVGGLNLHLFRRTPFYEFAELELNASHLEKAKTAISMLSSNSRMEPVIQDLDISGLRPKHHPCAHTDWAFTEQMCNEMVQRGDVHVIEGDRQKALRCYLEAIEALSAVENGEVSESSALAMVNARCWRKYTRHHSEIIDLSDTSAVETLLNSMKTLKRTLKRCGARLERVKCMLELGRINIKLLRSSSSRAFASLERTISLLEEAYSLGDCLGIAHLSQELRATLGMAYFAEIEESARGDADRMDGDRARFLSWSSSALLANSCSTTECEMVSPEPADSDAELSSKEALMNQLQQLSARPGADQTYSIRKQVEDMTQSLSEKVHELPSSWVIVSLMMGLSSELVVTRFTTNGTAPISFCLPNVSWKSCIDKMDAIVEKSREILSGHTAEEAGSWSTKQKKEWWDTRKQLDERIQKSVRSMEMTLGFWRCLLVKGTSTLETQCVQQCWSLLTSRKACPVLLAERNQSLLCAIADAQQWLSDGEVVNGLNHIAAEIDVPLSDSGLQEALQLLRKLGQQSGLSPSRATHSSYLPKLRTDKIQKMKVSELKQLLAAEGLSTDGLKKVLVERLIAARDAALLEPLTDQAARDQGFSTILILNHQLQQFPWEGMDIMGRSSGVTRMPSLDLTMQNARYVMQSRTSSYSSIRRDRVRFLLNPAGDLKATQNQLGPVLEGGVTTYGWEGIVGEVPDPDKLRNYLLAADLYIYCGHGSGEAYLHRDQVLSLKSGCSAALLFGCSSGRLKREGIFGPSGAVLAYLRAGSPAVLAMLWDVTDRDIDQLSVKILREWLLSEDGDSSPSLARVLQDSRSVCKLKYLNGHAAVCYGLPLHVAKS